MAVVPCISPRLLHSQLNVAFKSFRSWHVELDIELCIQNANMMVQ